MSEFPGYTTTWHPWPDGMSAGEVTHNMIEMYTALGLTVLHVLSAHKFKRHEYDVYAPMEVEQYGVEVIWRNDALHVS